MPKYKRCGGSLTLQNQRYREQTRYFDSILLKTDSSLSKITTNLTLENQVLNKSQELDSSQRQSLKYILGTGIPVIFLSYIDDSDGAFNFYNKSPYPIYDVKFSMFEEVGLLDLPIDSMRFHKQWTYESDLGNISSSGFVEGRMFTYKFGSPELRFFLSITTRNSIYREDFLFRKRGTKYSVGMVSFKIPLKKPFLSWTSSPDFFNPGEKEDLFQIIDRSRF